MNCEKIFQSLAERWFLSEPALFAVYCTHAMTDNVHMPCAMRSGKGRIEYNSRLLADKADKDIEEYLKAEVIRILLKHPYERKPSDCSDMACGMGSECVLSSYYSWKGMNLVRPSNLSLPDKQNYEWYAINIQKMLQSEGGGGNSSSSEDSGTPNGQNNGEGSNDSQSGDNDDNSQGDNGNNDNFQGDNGNNDNSQGNNRNNRNGNNQDSSSRGQANRYDSSSYSSLSELWEEDELMQVTINETIENIKQWGSIPGNLVETIKANTKARIDYRKILAGFCASVLSSKRNLTRMRPNRRTEFQNMGSVYRFRTNLLVAVDVSGSVSSGMLRHFFSIINRFFRYGVENIDVVQFDCEVGQVESIKKASTTINITGRGGTDFQPVIDLAAKEGHYDGLIILTDGYADHPTLPKNFRTRILWICEDQKSYDENHKWMSRMGRVCTIIL